jgi:hypothetical protein
MHRNYIFSFEKVQNITLFPLKKCNSQNFDHFPERYPPSVSKGFLALDLKIRTVVGSLMLFALKDKAAFSYRLRLYLSFFWR